METGKSRKCFNAEQLGADLEAMMKANILLGLKVFANMVTEMKPWLVF